MKYRSFKSDLNPHIFFNRDNPLLKDLINPNFFQINFQHAYCSFNLIYDEDATPRTTLPSGLRRVFLAPKVYL